jgi:hypothetical protein
MAPDREMQPNACQQRPWDVSPGLLSAAILNPALVATQRDMALHHSIDVEDSG